MRLGPWNGQSARKVRKGWGGIERWDEARTMRTGDRQRVCVRNEETKRRGDREKGRGTGMAEIRVGSRITAQRIG